MPLPSLQTVRRLLAASALVAVAAPISYASPFETVDFSGILETHTALTFDNAQLQTNMVTFTPEFGVDVSPSTRFTLVGRFNVDFEDRLEPGQPPARNRALASERLFIGNEVNAEIREAYVDTEIGATFLRLGKQQIVWGQADGLKLLDVLNPQTFREFVLPEFDDSRIALWSVNAEIPINELVLQLVWIPDTTYDDIPEQGSAFAFTSQLVVPQAPEGVPVDFLELNKPSDAFSDGDYGVKISGFIGGWDLTLNYAYHYFDRPVLRRFVAEDSITVSQEYERTHLMGGTFSNVFGDFTLRGELGYSTNRFFLTQALDDVDGVVRSNEAAYVIGLDYSGLTDWFFSAQLFQSYLTSHQPGMARGSVDSSMTFLARRNFMNDALVAEILLIQSLSEGDGLVQAAAIYEWRSNVRFKLGLDIFYGEEEGLFGQFGDADRVTAGIEFAF